LVHRSQLQQAAGDWSEAISSVAAARERLSDPPHPALGLAWYQEAELHRLRGAIAEATAAYRQASRHGYEPMPGLALLDLGRGDTNAAVAGIRRALDESHDPAGRAPLLAAAVDILRASGDVSGARSAADELSELAGSEAAEVLDAIAAQARGTVLIAEGDPRRALSDLRTAVATWQSIPMPYEAARTSVLIGLACAMLGDRTSAALEFENARETYTALGAVPDFERLERLGKGLVEGKEARDGGTLSGREREVLAHVAAGETNRQIAAALVISQHTVGRHLENIFKKIGVTSRAAATAYAYEHDLI
jgi:ATP/maltotriose-dependent transcriptional regulator MalT